MAQRLPRLAAALALACLLTSVPVRAQVPAAVNATLADDATCVKPLCYVVKDYWPVKSCKPECSAEVCKRGYGAWASLDVCCSPGVAFPEGCGQRLKECWVVESYASRTCVKDDRKCLQGYGLWASEAACCAPGAAFPAGCRTDLVKSEAPCWVVDTHYPSRQCKASSNLCSPGSGVQSWPTREACCAPNAAFGEGCSTVTPKTPCWVVDTYDPVRRCRKEGDVAVCNRGSGVYLSKDVCCAPGVAFTEGCTV